MFFVFETPHKPTNLKTASISSSENSSLLCSRTYSSSLTTSSVDVFLKRETLHSQTSNKMTLSLHRVTHFYKLRSRAIQFLSSFRTRLTSSSVSAVLRRHVYSGSSASEIFFSSLSDVLLAIWPSSGVETSFTVFSSPKTTLFLVDRERVSLVSASNTSQLSYHSLDKNSKPLKSRTWFFSISTDKVWDITFFR